MTLHDTDYRGMRTVCSVWLKAVTANAVPDELPILARSRQGLARLLTDDLAPLRTLSMALMGDPAMALRVLQQANVVPHRHFRADVVTLEDAAHMLGTQTLLRLESEAAVDERVLNAERLAPYRRSAGRAVLAALFAYDWAEIDHDRFPSEVSLAALLNNLGELFLLAHGDARISRYLELVEGCHVLPHEAEYVSLGESLEDLGHVLAVQWGLPEMVREAMRARNARHPRALCVMLATQIARYAFSAWRHPMQMDDLHLAGIVLELELPDLAQRINRVLDHFNRTAADYGLAPLKSLPIDDTGRPAVLPAMRQVVFGLAPRQDDYAAAMTALREGEPVDRESVFAILLRGLHRGLGLNRVVFAAYRAREDALVAEYLVGTDFEPSFNRFSLSRPDGGLFAGLLDAPSAVWLNDDNQAALAPRIPVPLLELIGVTRFFVMSLWVRGRVIGLVYADRRTESCHLDARSYQSFRELVGQAVRCLEHLAE
ncbi:HD-like signal output (HDOD) protein [Thiobaca trueperi]|uniref:HD-like signal output (HDOD) protein n=1 Tax=Thiobaca trueperi TaxID=127458 RepID=A0A4V2V1H6_9GAMM|nr:HD-like signal output (HDOD) protein [Thiobaca trueperi]